LWKNLIGGMSVTSSNHGFRHQTHGGHKLREHARVKTEAASGGGQRPVFTRVWARGTISSRRSMAQLFHPIADEI